MAGRFRDATAKDAVVVVRRMSGGIGARVYQGAAVAFVGGIMMAVNSRRGGGTPIPWGRIATIGVLAIGISAISSYEVWVHVGRRELVKGVVMCGVRFDFGWRAITREGRAVEVEEKDGAVRVGLRLKKGKVEWFDGDEMLAEELRVAVGE